MPIITFQAGVPSGTIAIWMDTLLSIPIGWKLCDGTNGTPNLRDRYPKCVPTAGTNPGSTGGIDAVVLTEAQLPSHDHSFSVSNHEHDGQDNDVQSTTGSPVANTVLTGQSFGINDLELDISTTHFVGALDTKGNDVGHENKPRSKDVLYIQKE